MRQTEADDAKQTRWAHELLTSADPDMSIERALVAQQRRSNGGPFSIGYEAGGKILCKLSGIASRTALIAMTCEEVSERIRLRGLWQSVEAAKAGTHIEDPYEPDAEDGGDPYDEPLPVARRAGRGEAREIAGRRVDASMFQAEGL